MSTGSQGPVLVINADDLGMSRGATLGIVKAHREGVVTSASLVTTTPDYAHAVEICHRECPDLGLGLHFVLSAGRPLSEPARVPLLVDSEGYLRWRFTSLLRATRSRLRQPLLDQIEAELEAQLERMIADGNRPDHLDSERHVHLIPAIFERVAAVAARRGIPFIRAGTDVGWGEVRLRHLTRPGFGAGVAKSVLLSSLIRRNRRRLDGSQIRVAESFASFLYSGRLDLILTSLLHHKTLQGPIEVMVHPGLPEQSGGTTLGNRALERYLASEDRRRELAACIEARSLAGGVRLGRFRDLAGPPSPTA